MSETEVAPVANARAAQPSFIYAVGRVEPQFSNIALEKEFAQVVGRTVTTGLTDRQVFLDCLSERANRYLARKLCWVLNVGGMETYMVIPRDPSDIELLVDSLRPRVDENDLTVVIGTRGPLAPPELCNGNVLPTVYMDQMYSFERQELIDAIPIPTDFTEDDGTQFRDSAGNLMGKIIHMTENLGATDEHRALNYLMVRYSAIYEQAAKSDQSESSFTGVEARRAAVTDARRIVDVIFSYTHRRTDVTEKWYVRVDIEDEFPFLVKKLSPYYEMS